MTQDEFDKICSQAASKMDDRKHFANYVMGILGNKFQGDNEVVVVAYPDIGPIPIWKESSSQGALEWQGFLGNDTQVCVIAFN